MRVAFTRRRTRRIAGVALALATVAVMGVWLGSRRARGKNERRRSSMTEENKRVARRLLEEAFGQGRLELIDELAAADSIGYDPALPEPTRGTDALKQLIAGYRDAFPDLSFNVDQQLAEGDCVATRWTARGTQRGEFWGAPASGKQATITGTTIDRIADGKIVESWVNWDTFGLLQQLGMAQAPVATT
jgi:steroid delta-isomerase-like uncharacterized protein